MTNTSEVTMEKQRDKHNHSALRPEPLPLWTKIADVAMRPLMFVLGGFRRDSMQETHPWHCQRDIDPSLIDPALTVTTNGETDELLPGRFSFLFHAPGLVGWRHYAVLRAKPPFHIGWVVRERGSGQVKQSIVHRLLINDQYVRMLSGPAHLETEFFAVHPDGTQIGLEIVDTGVLGDNKYPKVRLL